jgi:hypothetical protein
MGLDEILTETIAEAGREAETGHLTTADVARLLPD